MQNVNANWFNHVENIVDISHLAWLHGYTFPAYGGSKVTYHWERTDLRRQQRDARRRHR